MSDTPQLNREARRLAQKRGLTNEDGTQVRQERTQTQGRPKVERVGPAQYLREVRGELKKVSWPTRDEVINYSLVVLVLVTLLTASIGVLDYGIGEAMLALFGR